MLSQQELNAIIGNLLRESAVRSVTGAFERLLSDEISLPASIQEVASDSQKHLREFLSGEADRDASFPRIMSINDNDFLGGSFARKVKIRPLDDIDVYLPLDGHSLSYQQNGIRLPYTVVSDGVIRSNPLLQARWMAGSYISSQKLIAEFADVLRRHYPEETEVRPNGEAVAVRMSYGETPSDDGLGYDVVPCFRLKPDTALELPFYLIPDGANGWIRTNPRYDQDISDRLQRDNDKTFRKVVRLIKYWNEQRLGGAFASYYVELAIMRAFIEKNREGTYVRSISYGVALGFWALLQAAHRGNQSAWINNAPPVELGSLTKENWLNFVSAEAFAREAWNFEQAGNHQAAIGSWRKVFGPSLQGAV